MLKRALLTAGILIVSFASFASFRASHRMLCRGFLPPNSMKIPAGGFNPFGLRITDKNATGISKETYEQVLNKAQEIYGPIVKSHGGNLVINHLWEDPTVNSDARRDGDNWILDIDGGIARYKTMTEASFTLVVCHELGHQLGGYPKEHGILSELFHGTWASNEGEADYFATLKCLPRMIPATTSTAADTVVTQVCKKAYGQNDSTRCVADSMAANPLVDLFQALGAGNPASYAKPDPSRVFWTKNGHPDPQCRLDTYFAGALCTQPIDSELSDTTPEPGACTLSQGMALGLRPRCWYAPPQEQQTLPMASNINLPKASTVNAKLQAMSAALTNSW